MSGVARVVVLEREAAAKKTGMYCRARKLKLGYIAVLYNVWGADAPTRTVLYTNCTDTFKENDKNVEFDYDSLY